MFTSRSDSYLNGITGRVGRTGTFLCLANHKAWTAAARLPGHTAKPACPWFFLCEP